MLILLFLSSIIQNLFAYKFLFCFIGIKVWKYTNKSPSDLIYVIWNEVLFSSIIGRSLLFFREPWMSCIDKTIYSEHDQHTATLPQRFSALLSSSIWSSLSCGSQELENQFRLKHIHIYRNKVKQIILGNIKIYLISLYNTICLY